MEETCLSPTCMTKTAITTEKNIVTTPKRQQNVQ